MVTREAIVQGLGALGLDRSSAVIAHTSLRSFGQVDGGADTVCAALLETCGTALLPSGSWDLTGVPAPPGLVRPNNAAHVAESWQEFEQSLAAATPFSLDLPVDRWLGVVPETMRRNHPHVRSPHPLFGFLAVGDRAEQLIAASRADFSLGPLDALAELGGEVLLLGVDHTSNTAIHLAEQRLGRSRFHRCAKVDDGVWAEFPNISGESHRFDEIEPALAPFTTETKIGQCRARRIAIADVLATTERLITADPTALLCQDADCRCGAALRQRLAAVREPVRPSPRA